MDNFSRAILGLKASLYCNPLICLENLKEVKANYQLQYPVSLITDDGSENKGRLLDFIANQDGLIKNIIAQKNIVQSNGMVEAANKKLKYRFLYNMHLPDFNSVQKSLPTIKEIYNNTPLVVLSAYTSLEILAGSLPDSKRFNAKVKLAINNRKQVNQNVLCTDACKAKFNGSF